MSDDRRVTGSFGEERHEAERRRQEADSKNREDLRADIEALFARESVREDLRRKWRRRERLSIAQVVALAHDLDPDYHAADAFTVTADDPETQRAISHQLKLARRAHEDHGLPLSLPPKDAFAAGSLYGVELGSVWWNGLEADGDPTFTPTDEVSVKELLARLCPDRLDADENETEQSRDWIDRIARAIWSGELSPIYFAWGVSKSADPSDKRLSWTTVDELMGAVFATAQSPVTIDQLKAYTVKALNRRARRDSEVDWRKVYLDEVRIPRVIAEAWARNQGLPFPADIRPEPLPEAVGYPAQPPKNRPAGRPKHPRSDEIRAVYDRRKEQNLSNATQTGEAKALFEHFNREIALSTLRDQVRRFLSEEEFG